MSNEAYVYIPEELRHKIPALYATEKETNPTIWVKLFTPDAGWTWYIIEFDGDDLCFGFVVGHAAELGYFLLSDIACARGGLGLPVERDLSFQPKYLEEIKNKHP
jgi:Protein of unknown function (DUF2958).